MIGDLSADDHREGAADGDQHVGAKPGVSATNFALETDGSAGECGKQQANDCFERPAECVHPLVDLCAEGVHRFGS